MNAIMNDIELYDEEVKEDPSMTRAKKIMLAIIVVCVFFIDWGISHWLM